MSIERLDDDDGDSTVRNRRSIMPKQETLSVVSRNSCIRCGGMDGLSKIYSPSMRILENLVVIDPELLTHTD